MRSNFSEWTLDKIDDAFGTVQVDNIPELDELLAFEYEFSDYERRYLTTLADKYLHFGGDDWNEVELENKFISPLIVFADIDNKKFAYFLERELSGVVGEYELTGKIDGMIASGYRNPRKPFFCLKKYKRQTDPNGDPRGQAVIAMIVGQHHNADNKPVYGCYIVGKSWHFMVLKGKEYAISNVFVGSDNEIFDIYRILKGLRVHIERLI